MMNGHHFSITYTIGQANNITVQRLTEMHNKMADIWNNREITLEILVTMEMEYLYKKC